MMILGLSDCSGVSNLQTCRTVEGLLADALQGLDEIVSEASEMSEEGENCLSCDAGPKLAPLAQGLLALGRLLAEKGYEAMAPLLHRMEERARSFESLRCCEGNKASEERSSSSRENDARAVLTEKCGASFVDNRRGLRQVVRAPGDHAGCYQSRACRKPGASSDGSFMEAGFWTYDGEYWYIWAERLTPRGEWTSCDP